MYEKITYYSRMSQTLHVPVPAAGGGGTGLKTGLVAYWEFETLTDSTTNAITLSQVNPNTSGITAGGIIGQCYTNDNSDAHQCVASNDALLNIVGTDFSYAGWFKTADNTQSNQGMIVRGQNNFGSTGLQFYIVMTAAGGNNTILATLRDAGADVITIYNGVALSNNTWYQVALTVNRGLSQFNGYFNGSPVAGNPQSITTTTPTDTGCYLRMGNAAAQQLNGSIDQWGFWTRCLSDADVASHYNGGAGITYAAM